ncbi:ribonuclease R, partial [Bacteroidota bacterium]
SILLELVDKGNLTEIYTGKYKISSKAGHVIGKVDLTKAGYAYIISDDSEEDIFVSQRNLNHALDGDTVKVYCFARKKNLRPEGEVVEILHRKKSTFVGIVETSRNLAFLVPDTKASFDLFIPLEKLNGAKNGDKAIAKIIDWPKKAKNPFGEIIEVLGKPGEHEVEMHAILAEFGLPYKFSKEIEKAAEKIDETITKEEISKRKDYREVTTFTIDPHDAKDFDDALSIQQLKNGNWEIGIHIADVTHYINPKTDLDQEALNRGTSVYLVDRVVPMLPEKLSNKVCSLRPHEEKLCYSAVFEMNNNAEVLKQWFGRTIILSDRRFTYEEAQEVIETKKGDLYNEVLKLHELAQLLRQKRYEEGSIAFERLEVKFNIDEFGKPLGVYYKENKESNKLIEEFMLLANKKVAEFIGKPGQGKEAKTFVYRVHDKPNSEKLQTFNKFIKRFGYILKINSRKNISESLNTLLDEVRGKKEQNLIETLAVRSMAKAEYTTSNIGHYGLYFEHYTHFTSPIRRYPDMMVHRLLDAYLHSNKSKNKDIYEEMCSHSSDMEKRAIEAERASIKYKQVEFMMDKIGQQFSGIITGVTDWGLFVEIEENKCEGLVSIRELDDDFYELDEDSYCLIGKQFNKKYQLGDLVTIEVIRTDLSKKHLDFTLVEKAPL